MGDTTPDRTPGDVAPLQRPLLRYLGGKWRLAPWILQHFPPHEIYVEPFGGGASVLLRKDRARSEIYNDLDGQLVNLFRVLRSGDAGELVRQIALTPYARTEYFDAHELTDDELESARRLLVRSHMGHGTRGTRVDRSAGFRSDGTTGSTRVAGEWADFPLVLMAIAQRLRGVSIENRTAEQLLAYWDSPRTLFYLDPPYMPSTRSERARQQEGYHVYAHEMTVDEHSALLDQVKSLCGMVVLSGYATDLYDSALSDWVRVERPARSHRNSPRLEVLWLNAAAASSIAQPSLLDRAVA